MAATTAAGRQAEGKGSLEGWKGSAVGRLIGALFCSIAACLLALGTAVDSDGALFLSLQLHCSGASSIVAAAGPDILGQCMLTGGERYGTGLTSVSEMLLATLL